MLSYLEWVTRSLEHADNHQISGGVVAEIQNFIRQHYQENISLNMLAEQFYMHPNYLSRLFKEKTGKNFVDYLVQIRMQKVKELLKNSDYKIIEICSMVGYDNPRSFSKAFKHYAENYPDATVLLVDTYDVVKSGIPNAIRCAKEVLEPMGKRLKGIRLDSGDLAYLSKKVRKMLDDAGLTDCKIVVSNSLDEWTIMSILEQGGCIDSFGVGERLITAKSDPVFGAVYKIAAVEENGVFQPRIKISENVEKITNPGLKKVYRIYDENKKAIADLIAGADEVVDLSQPYRYVDPVKPWKNRYFENCTAVELQQLVVKNGKRVMDRVSIDEIKKYVQDQLTDNIWEEEQRFENPHNHYLDMSPAYYDMKMSLLHKLTD